MSVWLRLGGGTEGYSRGAAAADGDPLLGAEADGGRCAGRASVVSQRSSNASSLLAMGGPDSDFDDTTYVPRRMLPIHTGHLFRALFG
jgi:hypothetical protein